MPNVKMKDTTAHASYGSMRLGEVYAVSEEDAAHLVQIGLATKTTASTSAEREQELAEGDLDEKPSIDSSSQTPNAPLGRAHK